MRSTCDPKDADNTEENRGYVRHAYRDPFLSNPAQRTGAILQSLRCWIRGVSLKKTANCQHGDLRLTHRPARLGWRPLDRSE